MAIPKQHRILIATDGSRPAQAALATAARFPWPDSSRACVLVSRFPWIPADSEAVRSALEICFEGVSAAACRAVSRRWPEAKSVVIDVPPVDAILAEAERFQASLIVLGWRGHGTFRRLLAGSVSRSVAAHAQCPVLVVRDAASAVRHFIVGFDGCPNAERALDFLSSLEPTRGSRVVLVNVVEPVSVPAQVRLLASPARGHVRREVDAFNAERQRQPQAMLAAGVTRLERSGWTATSEVRVGDPLTTLLKAVAEHRADMLVLGARATSGLERALLGSVANGALNHSPVPVLLAR